MMERGVSTHAMSADEGDGDEAGSDEDMGYEEEAETAKVILEDP